MILQLSLDIWSKSTYEVDFFLMENLKGIISFDQRDLEKLSTTFWKVGVMVCDV
jgi:hypothetical protein